MNRPPLLDMNNALRETAEPDTSASGVVRRFFEGLLYRTDWLMVLPMVILLVVGEVFVYGTGQQVGGFAAKTFWRRHLIYIAVGSSVWLTVSILDYSWSGLFSAVLYPFTVVLLVVVLFYGVKLFGARSWLEYGPVHFQPSELAKFALVVLCAWVLSMKKADVNHLLWLLLIVFLLGVPAYLTKLQPDLGTALTMVAPVAGMIFAAKLKWRYVIILLVAAAVVLPAGYHFLKPYQQERILVFLDPARDPQNRGWNQLQAEMAVGAGGFRGKGFMKGTHNLLGYLPQKVTNSDFIFPVIAEETGFLGACGVVLLYMLLLFSIFRTALLAPDEFGRYLCVGVAILLFFHIYVNIAMSIRMCPVTGLPLPLVSYGGTFLVTTMTYLGLVHSVYGHRERKSVFDL